MGRLPLLEKQELAVALRRQGWSIRTIAKQLQVARSSVTFWVKDIELTIEQRIRLRPGPHPNPELSRSRYRLCIYNRTQKVQKVQKVQKSQKVQDVRDNSIIKIRIARMRAIKLQYFKEYNTYYLPDELARVVDLGP